MPLINSSDSSIRATYSTAELIERANYMRGLNLISLCSAGSGHSGGTLGVMDIAAALYLSVASHDPEKPEWEDRDRIVWSAGHKAPALYTSLAVSGYFEESKLMTLRMLGSPLQGHPHWRDLPGVEMTAGSLGQGFSVAVGMALAAKLDRKEHNIFVISSDGEQQEGSMWEAAMAAAFHNLDRLILIIDRNQLQIDGKIDDIMAIEPLADKYRAFGWQVIECDGHDIAALTEQLDLARNGNKTGKPTVLICDTVKGKSISFMENALAWHGKVPNRDELDLALSELGLTDTFDINAMIKTGCQFQDAIESRLKSRQPEFSQEFWWNSVSNMQVEMDPTRKGFGRALDKHGDDKRIVCIGADISDSITISDFYKKHPDRNDRFISVGIAEQNGTTIAAGLAREGKIPVFGTYGVFSSARNLDQLRVSICYANLNVLIVGAHGGVSVGPDGATHQELEAIFQIAGLPNMHLGLPCDAIETEKMTKSLLFDIEGPKYMRFAREATPVITKPDSPFELGRANIYRFRQEAEKFIDAFDISLASDYVNENEALTIIATGPEVAEALRAAYILKTDFDIETRVINMHTVKPLDREAVIRAGLETSTIITAEEHQVGGLGNLIANVLATEQTLFDKPIKLAMIGVEDRFGESGKPWQLIKEFGLSAEHIAKKAIELLNIERL